MKTGKLEPSPDRAALLEIFTIAEKGLHKYTDDERIPLEMLQRIMLIVKNAMERQYKPQIKTLYDCPPLVS